MNKKKNLTMLTDFYELTMAGGYFNRGFKDKIAVFDMFFRKVPDGGGFAIFAGLNDIISYLKGLHFTAEDIEYLRKQKIFSEEFLEYLKDFEFVCDVYSVPEGTVVFPGEPIITVRGPVIQAQLVETMILLTANHQSLIATKANRMVRVAGQGKVLEFGARRAQSYDAAILGARAAYIGGCIGTSCTIADRYFNIPISGTMAHSWVQMFDSEYDAFVAYAQEYPENCVLLIDTYNVIKSGIPNAIKTFNNILKPMGIRPVGVRIDSGDIAYLSKRTRAMLDEAGYSDVKIVASNSLDEFIIRDLNNQGARVDIYGVGENLITSKSDPVFGGVYKLVAIESEDGYIPKIKVSETAGKITTPHFKKVYRIYNKENNKAIADYVAIYDEKIPEDKLVLFDPADTWKKKKLTDYRVRELQTPIFEKGKQVYKIPNLEKIRDYCKEEVDSIWDEVKRFEFPHRYYVDLSKNLWKCKQKLLDKISKY